MSWKSKIIKKRSILIQVTLMRNLSKIFAAFNPLTPRSDQQVTSPCDILTTATAAKETKVSVAPMHFIFADKFLDKRDNRPQNT